MSRLPLVLMFLACVSCSKKKPAAETGSAGSAAMAEGSGSAATAEGSAGSAGSAMMAGSGSAMAGSAEGSGSAAMAGSGSAAEADEAGEGSGSGFVFDKLSHDDKVKFMKEKVVPAMKPVFQKFDAKKYAKFGCKTCHGKNAKAHKFKMPTPDLPKLDFAALKAGKQKPKVAEWMTKVVKPDMAKLLNRPEYTDQNPKGFGCLDCHEQKK